MADVAEEGVVIAAGSSLLVAASFGAATVLNKRKKTKCTLPMTDSSSASGQMT